MLLWWCFELAELHEFLDDTLHHLATLFDVGHFSPAEENGDLHLVFMLKKVLGLLDFEFDVMLTRFGTQSNFLGLRHVTAVTVPLFLFVLVFAEVHDSANRRALIWRHFNQVQA